MIIDIEKFIKNESGFWSELENYLDKIEKNCSSLSNIEDIKRIHYLYQRASSDLARMNSFSANQKIRQYLEALVSRTYSEIHDLRSKKNNVIQLIKLFFILFPVIFRKNIKAFYFSCFAFIIGIIIGGVAISIDDDTRSLFMPFGHHENDPSKRVENEESETIDNLDDFKARFSAKLIANNIRVSIFTMILGISFGIGTFIYIFYNGTVIGAVGLDYIRAGETKFLFGWLLPHGSIEIPSLLIAGQAGLIIGSALIGWGTPVSFKNRFRSILKDLLILITGVAFFLVWAGFIESYFSQYHEPFLPYEVKIGFGCLELLLLVIFLSKKITINDKL
ncbi:MAG: stage II sporulation protein M [Desulfobacterales bacterium]|nr:stage II sporulation protein M [Desulfobacterales bacterium]